MALAKRVKVGGAYYRGYKCAVSSVAASYTTIIANTSGAAINGLSITPDDYGALDKMKIEHFSDASGTGNCMAVLAEDIYNVGAHTAIMLDFPSMELVNNGESIKFTYVNTASVAMNVYLIAEFIGIKKTA